MENKKMANIILQLFDAIAQLVPVYMENPLDKNISNGNLAACIIDSARQVHGKMFGSNKT